MALHLLAQAKDSFKQSRHTELWRRVGLLLATFIASAYYAATACFLLAIYSLYRIVVHDRIKFLNDPAYGGSRYPPASSSANSSLATSGNIAWGLCFVVVMSLIVMPVGPSEYLRTSRLYKSVALYFDASVWSEIPAAELRGHPKPILMLVFPHGVVSLGGWAMGSLFLARPAVTGCADVVLWLPVLRQLFAPFWMCSSSRGPMAAALASGTDVCLYSGGLAEMFMSDKKVEQLYFRRRRGCVKLAMECGADIRIVYLFGNTSMFRVWGGPYCARISRLCRTAMCLFWGRYGLPIPFKTQIACVISQTIVLPHIPKPSPAEVEEHHTRILKELTRVYETHKNIHPEYRDKPLVYI